MLILNGVKFALNEEEFTNSLFASGGTCSGYYKKYYSNIRLFNHNMELIGVINPYGVLCKASLTKDGYWYSYGDIELIGKHESYRQEVNETHEALEQMNIKRKIA